MENEIWKFIPDTNNGYMISINGKVKSLDRMVRGKPYKGKVLKPYISCGYLTVCIRVNDKIKYLKIHRLMAYAFIGNPKGLPCIDHIDRDKLNNGISNLRFCSFSENSRNRDKFKNKSSKYVGVTYDIERSKYKAYVKIDKRLVNLGRHETEESAANAYNKYVIENGLSGYNINIIL